MHTADFHEKAFDEETLCKLDIYRQYLRAWLPVFLNRGKNIQCIQIFDFFAGPGHDAVGTPGSPLIAAEEIRSALAFNASKIYPDQKIRLFLNEPDDTRFQVLKNETKPSIDSANTKLETYVSKSNFQDIYYKSLDEILKKNNVANFIFLDQFGVKETTREILQSIWSLATTDMMFFISSSSVNRFKQDKSLRRYIPEMTDEEYIRMNGSNATRILYDAYARWIPEGQEYYLGHFSIKRKSNVYGLIFGSRHPLGMEKFLNVAWDKDKLHGEANFDIDGDGLSSGQPFLFPEMEKPTKIKHFEERLLQALKEHKLKNNKDLYLFGIRNGMLSRHVREAFEKMKRDGILPRQKMSISYDAWKRDEVQPIIF